jgi:hypothetical protein
MSVGDGQDMLDSRAPARLHAMTPNGRFYFDGQQWQATPLAPEVPRPRKRVSPALIWTLIVLAGVVGGLIIFELLVVVGLEATH